MAALALLAVCGGAVLLATAGGGCCSRGSGSEIPSPTTRGAAPIIAESEVDPPSNTESIVVGLEPAAPIILFSGFLRTEAGALAAAISYLEATEEVVTLTPADAAAAQSAIATAEFADEFAADTEQRMTELAEAVPGGITLRLAPIEARSVAHGDDWLVSIWYVQAITLVGETVVDDWRTANYRMRWEDDTWKIASFESNRGPMPGRGTQPASATPTQFEALLAGFSDDGLS